MKKEIILKGNRGNLSCILFEPEAEARGAVLFLPGMPGTDQNEDIAEMLCRENLRILCLSYSGSNDSDGAYSLQNALEDGETAYRFLQEKTSAGVSILGHSMGGFVCAQLAARHPGTKAAVMMFPCDIGRLPLWETESFMTSEIVKDFFYTHAAQVKGTTSDRLLSEVFAHADSFSLVHLAPALAGIPICMIGGAKDHYAPPKLNCFPLRDAIEKIPGHNKGLLYREFPDGHYGAESRGEISRSIVSFFKKYL